jgi:hypothetical protein
MGYIYYGTALATILYPALQKNAKDVVVCIRDPLTAT